MGRGDFGNSVTSKSRTSLSWLFLLLVPVAIVLIHFDVLSFGTRQEPNFPTAAEKGALEQQPVSADMPIGEDSVKDEIQTVNPVSDEGMKVEVEEKPTMPETFESSVSEGVPLRSTRKLLVGEGTAATSRTCTSDLYAVDDEGNSCMHDLQYRLADTNIFMAERPDATYMVCAIPKNGCTYHIAMINRIHGEEDYEVTGVIHDVERKRSYKLATRGTELAARMLANTSIPKYVVVRNPLQRTMSAYLNKVEHFYPEHEKTVEKFHEWVYREYPRNLPIDRSWVGMNPHWLPQMQFCGFRLRDVHSHFKIFRVEEPADYVDYMYNIIPDEYLKDGWAKTANISFREHVLGPRIRTEGTSEKFLKYFNNLELFDHLARVLTMDIEAFGYQEEVAQLRESVKERVRLVNMDEDDDLD